jgi:predicted neuraminidase
MMGVRRLLTHLRPRTLLFAILFVPYFSNSAFSQNSRSAGIVKEELLFEEAPFAECHASTIVQVEDGLVVAFFGGTGEKHPDVGIWLTRWTGGKWSPPVEAVNGIQPNGTRLPCWNPVLFQIPGNELLLFYKVGPNPVDWWGMVVRSGNGGRTWSIPERLPTGILGPIKNKPLLLSSGVLLSPSSTESNGWKIHLESSSNGGQTWTKTFLPAGVGDPEAIQPTILTYRDGRLQLLCRSKQNRIVESWSSDSGQAWSRLELTSLPNPNSGIDAVTLRDGRQFLVYNHTQRTEGAWGGPRSPLNAAVSIDGKKWFAVALLEQDPGEFSYPAVIQTSDNRVHVTYTWKRKSIKHVIIDPSKCVPSEIKDGRWPRF